MKTAKKITHPRDISEIEVEKYADKHSLNIESEGNFDDARQALFDEKYSKVKKPKKQTNKFIEILNNDVKYNYDNGQDMPDSEKEHVNYMIEQGYTSGELNYVSIKSKKEKEVYGWWEIVNWKSIALDLFYIASDVKTTQAKKILKKFDENWN